MTAEVNRPLFKIQPPDDAFCLGLNFNRSFSRDVIIF